MHTTGDTVCMGFIMKYVYQELPCMHANRLLRLGDPFL